MATPPASPDRDLPVGLGAAAMQQELDEVTCFRAKGEKKTLTRA